MLPPKEYSRIRKWQPTPVFLPGESQGQRSLVAAIYGVTQSQTQLKRLSREYFKRTKNALYKRNLAISRQAI